MAIDAGIYGQIQQPQQQNPLNALAQAYQIRGFQSQMDKADRAEQQQNKLLQLVGSPEFSSLNAAQKAAKLQGVGAFDQASKLVESEAKVSRDAREAEKFQLEGGLKRMEIIGQVAGTVRDQASYEQGLSILQSQGIDTSKFNPIYDPAGVAQFANAAMSRKDQMEQVWKAKGYDLDVQRVTETNRHNQATEATSAGTLANAQERLAFDKNQPKGQVVQTDSGTMLVDPRTGEARPVTSGGVPVQKPGKDIPANVNKSIIDNQQSLGKIDRAIESITSNPKALGLQYAIPGAETVGQYIDSEGVPTRAAVADVGSLVLHDRSGAAVTVSEFPRLKPFIPTASDDPKAAVAKLRQLRKAMAEEADLLSQTYSKEQGFKESPVLKNGGAQKQPGGATPPAAAIAYLKANPGMRAQFEAKYGTSADAYLGK